MKASQDRRFSTVAPVSTAGAAITSERLPRWLRVALVTGLVVLACGVGLLAYRHATQPKTLTVAAGSLDGYVPRFMSAIAARMAASNSPVRLKVIDKGNTVEAVKSFMAGEADLAIARADAPGVTTARAVLVMTHAVVLIISLTGSIDSVEDLKGKTIGVVDADINRQIVSVITKEYDLDHAKVRFINVAFSDAAKAIQAKQVHAILMVLPISPRYLVLLRDLFPRNAKFKPALVPLDSAGAIAAIARAYESYELPKGTLRGLPPIPDEDLTTLRVPFYLIARQSLDNDIVEALAKAVMDARRDLISDHPILAQISAPDTDKDAFVPIHPGAAAFFEGEAKTIFDKYGDQFFYGSMVLGSLMSILAAIWKFMTRSHETAQRPMLRLYALMGQISESRDSAELASVEAQIDDILKRELERYSTGAIDAGEMGALGLATHRLEYAMVQRRLALNGTTTAPIGESVPRSSAGEHVRWQPINIR